MPALHTASALSAATDVNVELALNGPTRNLDLILVVDVRFVDLAAAIGTLLGQRRFVNLVDLLGWIAMRLGAVVLARLTARLFRFGFRWPLAERSSLAFAGATLLVEKASEMLDLRAEFGGFAFETDTVGAWFSHTFTLAAA
jgi:hypothetical protein